MSSENAEALLQPKDIDIESQNERLQVMGEGIGMNNGQGILRLKQLKSFEILKSALKIFTKFLSLSITMKIATKVHAAEKQTTLKELLHQNNNIKGPFITYLYVHLLSSMTLFGLFWIVFWNHLLFSGSGYSFQSINIGSVVYIAIHSVMFLALLYKFLGWSAFWNMGIVISFTEELTGIAAFGLSDYYGRHNKKIGFQLILGFFVFGNVLRLPCLYAGLCNGSVAGVLITCIVMMLVSIGNLVKWGAFLLYFYHCKQQTMEKKVDDQELAKTKTVKAAGVQS